MTAAGMSSKRIDEASKSLSTAMGTYERKVKPLPDKLKKILDRLPGS